MSLFTTLFTALDAYCNPYYSLACGVYVGGSS